MKSLLNDIPNRIDTSVLNGDYEIQDYIMVAYPIDFKDKGFNKTMVIANKAGETLSIEVDMKFDYPYSMFAMQLLDHTSEDDDDDDEEVLQMPLMVDRGDDYSPVLNRQLHSARVESSKSYSLSILDNFSFKLMDFIK